MPRTSSYTIYVDLPNNSSEMLLVHGYTGAYDRVSRRVASYVRSLERKRAPKPLYGDWRAEPELETNGRVREPSADSIKHLKKRGYLTEMTHKEEQEFFGRFVTRLHEQRIQGPPRYIMMPTYDCNLRCSYCFQDHMRSDKSFRHLLRAMSRETIDRIFDSMPRIEAMHNVDPARKIIREIGFFGGEPLLASSRSAVEYIMEKAASMGAARFWAISNATELDAYEDLIGPEGIASIQITLDGPPEEHDKRRIHADGSGSFDAIARNVTLALERKATVNIRLNLDRLNIGMLPELAREILKQGWHEYDRFGVYTAPIRAENENTDVKTTYSTWQLDQELKEMASKHRELSIIGRPDDGIRYQVRRMFSPKNDINVPNFRETFCGAHDRMYIFDAFADIYACWEKTGDEKVRVGHIDEDGIPQMKADILQGWRSRTVASNPVCRQCRYSLHCGGGCAVLALAQSGKYHSNYCDGFASRFRESVAHAYLDHTAGLELETRNDQVCDM